jgi:hypothetical protein
MLYIQAALGCDVINHQGAVFSYDITSDYVTFVSCQNIYGPNFVMDHPRDFIGHVLLILDPESYQLAPSKIRKTIIQLMTNFFDRVSLLVFLVFL